MSAWRFAIVQGPPPGFTPRTTFSFTFGNVPSGFTGPAPFDTGITPIPPSNCARKPRPCAPTLPAIIPIVNTHTAAFLTITDRPFQFESRRALRESQPLLAV